MQLPLVPTRFVKTRSNEHRGGEWWRLVRTDAGILCVESISDDTLHRTGEPPAWAFGGDVPPNIARQLDDDRDPTLVRLVLDRALLALGYV